MKTEPDKGGLGMAIIIGSTLLMLVAIVSLEHIGEEPKSLFTGENLEVRADVGKSPLKPTEPTFYSFRNISTEPSTITIYSKNSTTGYLEPPYTIELNLNKCKEIPCDYPMYCMECE